MNGQSPMQLAALSAGIGAGITKGVTAAAVQGQPTRDVLIPQLTLRLPPGASRQAVAEATRVALAAALREHGK